VDYNYPVQIKNFLIVLMALFLAGCGLQGSFPGISTSTPFIITSTLPPTAIPSATLTPIPPTPSPTTAPVQGMTTTQVNVRTAPSAAAAQLGMIAPFANVQITGRDSADDWYQIAYSNGPDGKAWVTAQYINVPRGKDTIPIVGQVQGVGTALSGTAGPTASGTIIEQVNVRKGPGTSFDAVGTVNANESVTLIGKDAGGTWLEIQYPGAPDGKGWIAAAYVEATGLDALPIIGDSGVAVGTGTPPSTPPVIAPTPAAALDDKDSAEVPATKVIFSALGTRSLIFSSDVSAPDGDTEDWIEFTPDNTDLLVSLSCTGNSGVGLALRQGTEVIPGWDSIRCGETHQMQLAAGKTYLMRISISGSVAALAYVRYTLKLEELH
jgi:uncharacterized protein YraI